MNWRKVKTNENVAKIIADSIAEVIKKNPVVSIGVLGVLGIVALGLKAPVPAVNLY